MLKKLIYGLAMVGALTACTDDYDDWAVPQSNEPEESKLVNLTVKDTTAIDLATIEGDSVAVFQAQISAETGAEVSYRLSLSNADNDQKAVLAADNQGRVAVADLTETVVSFYGKRPSQRTLIATVAAYVNVNAQVVKKTAEKPVNILVTPVAPVIENEYYLLGDATGWDYAGAMKGKFSHSGKDVYDDPVFTITVPAPVDENGVRKDFYFKIAPVSALADNNVDWGKVIGSDTGNGDDRPEAGLQIGADGAFCQHGADEALYYKITLNMMDYRLQVEAINFVERIYMPGNPQGWNPSMAPSFTCSNGNGVYVGYGRLDGEFKFTKGKDWSDGEYNFGSFTSYGEGFSEGGGGNIKFGGEAGYYKIVADVANGSLTATLTNWGIIGPAQPGGWDSDTDMTYNATEDCWEATLDLKADEFKFRANDGWDINFGGDADNLTEGGNNIKLAEAGNYTVKLFISCSMGKTNRYYTLTKH